MKLYLFDLLINIAISISEMFEIYQFVISMVESFGGEIKKNVVFQRC
jgi:hypothetical protein